MGVCSENLAVLGQRSQYVAPMGYAMKSGTKAWIKNQLDRRLRRQPVPTWERALDAVPHATYDAKGNLVASTGWGSAKRTAEYDAAQDFASALAHHVFSTPAKSAARLVSMEAQIRMDTELKSIAKRALSYTWGDLKTMLERACK